jgi:hypothetical protein
MTGLTAELAERSAELSFDRLPDNVISKGIDHGY